MSVQTFPCGAIKLSGKCQCKDFNFGRYDRHYTYCACGDTAGAHHIVESKFDFERHRHLEAGEARLPKKKAVSVSNAPVSYKVVTTAPSGSGEYSTGQMRDALRKAGIAVGERGRLSPDQKKQAISILNGGK